MIALYIETPFSRLRLENAHLVVCPPRSMATSADPLEAQACRRIPLNEIERLTLTETVQATSQCFAALLRRAVPIHYVDAHGRLLGRLDTPASSDGALRLAAPGQRRVPVLNKRGDGL